MSLFAAISLAFLILSFLPIGARPLANSERQPDDHAFAWVQLGPVSPVPIERIAPAADWPTDLAILAVRRDDLVRTSDGGATWEAIPTTLPRSGSRIAVSALILARQADGARVALAVTPEGIFRSPDFGSSWGLVLPYEKATGQLSISPTFTRDGTAFYVQDGSVFRSVDYGVRWEPVDPAPGWMVQSLAISPAFATDHTVFAATSPVGVVFDTVRIGHRLDTTLPLVEDDEPEAANEVDLGPGVLRSTDGGATWSPMAEGLEHQGLPFTAVRRLTISPTFAVDQTLFAVGAGPAKTLPYFNVEIPVARMALFRSADGGASWTLSHDLGSGAGGRGVEVALSPFFAADGMGFFASFSAPSSPASSGCTVWSTTNAGASWAVDGRRGSYESCSNLAVGGVPGAVLMVVSKTGLEQRLIVSGKSITAPPPTGVPMGAVVVAGPAGPGGRALFASSARGIWAWGPVARETAGTVPCSILPVAGFGRVWQTDGDVRARLGCAVESERPVRILVQTGTGLAGEEDIELWLEDDSESWYALSRPGNAASVISWPKAGRSNRSWVDAPDQVQVDGAVQRFEGGFLLFVPLPDGTRTIYFMTSAGSPAWRAFPD